MDPTDLDRYLVAMSKRCLEAISDDALPVALVFYDDAGNATDVVAFGDTSVFPELEPENGDPDQDGRSESDGEPRTEETRHQTPGESTPATEIEETA